MKNQNSFTVVAAMAWRKIHMCALGAIICTHIEHITIWKVMHMKGVWNSAHYGGMSNSGIRVIQSLKFQLFSTLICCLVLTVKSLEMKCGWQWASKEEKKSVRIMSNGQSAFCVKASSSESADMEMAAC